MDTSKGDVVGEGEGKEGLEEQLKDEEVEAVVSVVREDDCEKMEESPGNKKNSMFGDALVSGLLKNLNQKVSHRLDSDAENELVGIISEKVKAGIDTFDDDEAEMAVSFEDDPSQNHIMSSANKNRAQLPKNRRLPSKLFSPEDLETIMDENGLDHGEVDFEKLLLDGGDFVADDKGFNDLFNNVSGNDELTPSVDIETDVDDDFNSLLIQNEICDENDLISNYNPSDSLEKVLSIENLSKDAVSMKEVKHQLDTKKESPEENYSLDNEIHKDNHSEELTKNQGHQESLEINEEKKETDQHSNSEDEKVLREHNNDYDIVESKEGPLIDFDMDCFQDNPDDYDTLNGTNETKKEMSKEAVISQKKNKDMIKDMFGGLDDNILENNLDIGQEDAKANAEANVKEIHKDAFDSLFEELNETEQTEKESDEERDKVEEKEKENDPKDLFDELYNSLSENNEDVECGFQEIFSANILSPTNPTVMAHDETKLENQSSKDYMEKSAEKLWSKNENNLIEPVTSDQNKGEIEGEEIGEKTLAVEKKRHEEELKSTKMQLNSIRISSASQIRNLECEKERIEKECEKQRALVEKIRSELAVAETTIIQLQGNNNMIDQSKSDECGEAKQDKSEDFKEINTEASENVKDHQKEREELLLQVSQLSERVESQDVLLAEAKEDNIVLRSQNQTLIETLNSKGTSGKSKWKSLGGGGRESPLFDGMAWEDPSDIRRRVAMLEMDLEDQREVNKQLKSYVGEVLVNIMIKNPQILEKKQ